MRKSHFILLVVGVVLMAGGPAGGLLVTVQAMSRAVAASKAGTPAELADQVSEALTSTTVGLGVGALGLVLAVVALVAHFVARKRRKGLRRLL